MRDGRLLREYVEHGSQAAFAQIVERYLRLVYSACLRETGEAGLAEDAAQAVFLLLARKAPTLTGKAGLAGWLFAASRLVSRNAVRQERRRRHQEQKVGEAMLRADRDGEADAALWHEIEPVVNDALMALNGREREAILLRFFQGLSLAETGDALGVSTDAAQMRVSRALEKMRRHLGKTGVAVSGAALTSLLPVHAAHSLPTGGAAAVLAVLSPTGPGPLAGSNVYGLYQGAVKTMWITRMKIAAVLVGVSLLTVFSSVTAMQTFSAARHKPGIAKQSAIPASLLKKPTSHGQSSMPDVVKALQVREQSLSRVTFDWRLQSQTSRMTGPAQNSDYTTTWRFDCHDKQMLVSGTREEGGLTLDFAQYYEGPNGIIINRAVTANNAPVASIPPQIWGNSGDSFRWREPFQTGLNLTPEHFAMLAGKNPALMYGASWSLVSTTPRTWTIQTRVLPGLAPADINAYSIEVVLSRRLGGAPARITWTRGKETMQFQAQGFRRYGTTWICDQMEMVDNYPGIHTVHQTWALQSAQPSSLITVPLAVRSQVMDYRLIGLNLTTDDYLSAAQDRPQDVATYPWSGRFLSLAEAKTLKKP